MLARAGMLICPNGRPLLGSLVAYFYAWLRGVVPALPEHIFVSADLGDVLQYIYREERLRPLSNKQKERLPFGPSVSPGRVISGVGH